MGLPLALLVLGVSFYLFAIRPSRNQKRRREAMLAQLQPGAEIVSVGGLHGVVVEMRDEDLDLEIAEDVIVRLERRAIASVVSSPEPDEDDEEFADEELIEAESHPDDGDLPEARERSDLDDH